jgi:hypothetical protein
MKGNKQVGGSTTLNLVFCYLIYNYTWSS